MSSSGGCSSHGSECDGAGSSDCHRETSTIEISLANANHDTIIFARVGLPDVVVAANNNLMSSICVFVISTQDELFELP